MSEIVKKKDRDYSIWASSIWISEQVERNKTKRKQLLDERNKKYKWFMALKRYKNKQEVKNNEQSYING